MTPTISWKRLSLHDNATLFLLGEEAVLFSGKSRQLYGLDRIATAAVLRLEQGESATAIASDLGLTAAEISPLKALAAILAGDEPDAREYPNDLPCPLKPGQSVAGADCFRLLETVFAIEGPEELLRARITPFLAELRCDKVTAVDLLVSIEAAGDRWCLILNGVSQGEPLAADELLPLLHTRLRVIAYQSCNYLLALHGTVLVDASDVALVLAGSSGFGKSTLAAALLKRGFALASDEPVVIAAADERLRPLPLGLGLKEGSWPVILPEYPELAVQPWHRRFDGLKIRYLPPGSIPIAMNPSGYPATVLIFTRYTPGTPGHLMELSVIESLNLILSAGYQVPDLDEARVAGILAWLAGLRRYALGYQSTEEALQLISSSGVAHVRQ